MDLGRIDEAVTTLEQSAELTRATGMHMSLCNVLVDLTDVYRRRGDHGDAVRCAGEALEIATSAADHARQARINFQVGELALEIDDTPTARQHLTAALAYYSAHNETAAQRVRQALDRLPSQ